MLPDAIEMGSHSEWEEPIEREGCLLWRAWVGDVSVVHPVLRMARQMARRKAENNVKAPQAET